MNINRVPHTKILLSTLLLLSSLVVSPLAQAQVYACRAIPALMEHYFHFHITQKKLTPKIRKRSVEQFIKIVDSNKTLLLRSDVEKIKKNINDFISDLGPKNSLLERLNLFKSKKQLRCDLLYAIKTILVQRSVENEMFIKKMFGKDYKLDKSVEVVLDSDKRDFSKTTNLRHKFLTKLAHFQFSNYLITKTPEKEAKEKLIHKYELVTKRLRDKENDDFNNYFLNSFTTALDPHSSYLSASALSDFQIDMGLSLEGIGASLSSQDGYTVVEEIIRGGAAFRNGKLKEKDKIIGVGQGKKGKIENVVDMELNKVVKQIRGPKGSNVRLIILRKEEGKINQTEVVIKRDKVKLEERAAQMYMHDRKVGDRTMKLALIDFPSFYGRKGSRFGSDDIKKLIKKAKEKKAEGIVLNLSLNGGGLLDEAVKIGGLFIKKGNIVATREYNDKIEFKADSDPTINYNGPLVIMVSRRSASASEILAGAMRDYNRAVIVGSDHTYGKGSVQILRPISADLGAIKVTSGLFFVPGGYSTQLMGVKSHIEIPSVWNNEEIGEYKLDFALNQQKISPFVSKDSNSDKVDEKWLPISKGTVRKLADRSKKRVKGNEKFKEVLEEIKEQNKEEEVIKLSEYYQKSEKNEKKRKEDEDIPRKERIQAMQKSQIDEALNVLRDLILLQKNETQILGQLDKAESKQKQN